MNTPSDMILEKHIIRKKSFIPPVGRIMVNAYLLNMTEGF